MADKNIPSDKSLWERLKAQVKESAKVWPSLYASQPLTRLYKAKGGTFHKAEKGEK